MTWSTTDAGPLRAQVVVAADGTSVPAGPGGRRTAGARGPRPRGGLDAGPHAAEWADRVHLDWGPIPGSYGWVFPKGDTLTVGVIAARGAGDATKDYLRDLLRWVGLDGLRVLHDSGHPDPVPDAGLAARTRPGAVGRRRRGAARAVDPRGDLVRDPLGCARRRGRRRRAERRGGALPRRARRRAAAGDGGGERTGPERLRSPAARPSTSRSVPRPRSAGEQFCLDHPRRHARWPAPYAAWPVRAGLALLRRLDRLQRHGPDGSGRTSPTRAVPGLAAIRFVQITAWRLDAILYLDSYFT